MTTEERAQMNRPCQRIQIEKNPHVFMNLVEELHELLERKQKRLEPSARDREEYDRLMTVELNANIEATSAKISCPKRS
jgi:hypothetical protein